MDREESLPWLPARFEQALLSARIPYVLTTTMPCFTTTTNIAMRRCSAFGGKHAALMRGAALVVAGNALPCRILPGLALAG